MLRLKSAVATDVGLVRGNNEDAFFADDDRGFYVVADGMGGHENGEVASRLAVETCARLFINGIDGDCALTQEKSIDLMLDSIISANEAIYEKNANLSLRKSMGTTIAAIYVSGDTFVAGSVGDTRIYLVRDLFDACSMTQVSHDHTVAADLILRGVPPAMITGDSKRTLTQAVGLHRRVRPYLSTGSIGAGDALLLCSDGISDYLDVSQMQRIIHNCRHQLTNFPKMLVCSALSAESQDNCTCLICFHSDGF